MFWQMFNYGTCKIYLDVGDPILVDSAEADERSMQRYKRQIMEKAEKECIRIYRVNTAALVAHALVKGIIELDSIYLSVDHNMRLLQRRNVNVEVFRAGWIPL